MDEQGNWYRRKIGRPLERAVNRLVAGVFGLAGILAAYFSLPAGNDAGEVRWFGLIAAIFLFWLARRCITARGSVIEGFGEEPGGTRK